MRNDPFDIDDASLEFERLESAYEDTVLQDMAEHSVKAADGYTQTDVAKGMSEITHDTEKLVKGLLALPSPAEKCADANDAWAEKVANYEGWLGDSSMRRIIDARTDELRRTWATIDQSILRMESKDGYKPFQSMLETLMSDAHRIVTEGGDIRKATRKVADTIARSGGIRIQDNGRSYELYGWVRQRVWDTWHDTMQDYRDRLGRKVGMDAVEVSAHGLCAPDHQPFQGRIYTLDEFQTIQSSLQRPLGKYNCRHIMTPCWNDSEPTYSRQDLAKMDRLSNETVRVDGRDMTRYEASQWQRSMERSVRKRKMAAQVCESVGDREGALSWRREARKASKTYREGCEAAGLRPFPERLTVGRLA